MSCDGWAALPRGATGLSAVCDCGISWSYSLTIYFSISFLPLCTWACMRKAAFNAHFDVSTQRSISSSESSSYICGCEKARLSRICACSPEPSFLEKATSIKITWHCAVSKEPSLFERKVLYYIFKAHFCPIRCSFFVGYFIAVGVIARICS